MGSLVKKQAERFLRENQRHRRWLAIFLCLALVVTSGTFAALRMNGRAMDIEGKVLDCQLKVHQHTEDCFDENGELICGQADYVVHTHSAACYDGEGELVCQIPEREAHVHDDSCYTEEKTLICDQEESEGHHHTQDCYTKQIGEWICTQEAHEHNELCYDAEGNPICGIEPHQHGDACYEWNEVLTCGQEESEGHTHSDECYKTEKELTCGELELHEHDGPCYDENGVLTCKVPELKEHVHNEECFRDAETDDQFQGEEFESDGKDPGPEVVSGDTADENGEDGGTVSDDTVSGDIVSGDAVSSDTVSADTVSGNTDEAEETDEAREFSYEDDQVEINVRAAKKGIVPEDAELSVKPIVQQDVEALREDESVSENEVAEAEELNAKYEEVQKELEASVAEDETKELAGFLAYDISFLTEQVNEETGETEKVEIEPDGSVEVSMRFADAYIPEMPEKISAAEEGTETVSENGEKQAEDFNVDVVHLKETPDTATGETKLNAETLDADIQTTDDAKVSEVTFSADSFSTFTIAWYTGGETPWGSLTADLVLWDSDNNVPLSNDLADRNVSLGLTEMGGLETMNMADVKKDGKWEEHYELQYNGKTYYFYEARYVETGNINDIASGDGISDIGMDFQEPFYVSKYNKPGTKTTIMGNGKIFFLYTLPGETVSGPMMPTVETLKNADHNIKMYMHDFDFEEGITGTLGGSYKEGNEKGWETQELVNDELENGFPTIRGSNESLKSWFINEEDPESERVDHLFLKSEYDKNKTFYYSSYANYAYLDRTTNNFEVYRDAIGTIYKQSGDISEGALCGYGGNFFPYNSIRPGKMSTVKNRFTKDGEYSDPGDGKSLYLVEEPDYHFGLYLETNFVQEKGGRSDFDGDGIAEPMKYEFTGDDDLWVFINNKLVLDIGGIHDAVKGTIDFSTGKVTVGELRNGQLKGSVKETTLAEKLGETSEDIDPDTHTLKDYKTYSLKIFYLERNGANSGGGSALRMAFNLPTIGTGDVQVKKQLSTDVNEEYANLPFDFQLRAAPETSNSTPENPSYDNDADQDEYEIISANAGIISANEVGDTTKRPLHFESDGTFSLKPGETAIFSKLSNKRKFYVVETGFDSTLYDIVSWNGTQCTVSKLDSTDNPEEKSYEATTTPMEVDKGKRVVFTNNCTPANNREIQITKQLQGGDPETGPFDIEVNLEGTNGKLKPYTGEYYLIKDDNGQKRYFKIDNNNKVVSANDKEACTAVNGIVRIVPDHTVIIPGLTVGTDFQVKERTPDPEKYKPEYDIVLTEKTYGSCTIQGLETKSSGKGSTANDTVQGSITKGENAVITVTNHLKGAASLTYRWQIIKKGTEANAPKLSGAEFTLTGKGSDGKTLSYNGTSQTTGIVNFQKVGTTPEGEIPAGEYILQETKAPGGYQCSNVRWKITLEATKIIVEELDKDGKVVREINPASPTSTPTEGEPQMFTYTFLNTCIYELPSTGGDGIYWYLVSGIFLMMASTLILYKNRRKEVVRK